MEMSEKVKRMDDLLSGEVLSLLGIDALEVSDMFLLYDVCCSFSSFFARLYRSRALILFYFDVRRSFKLLHLGKIVKFVLL